MEEAKKVKCVCCGCECEECGKGNCCCEKCKKEKEKK